MNQKKNLYSQISVCFALFLRSCFSCIITFINTHFWLAVSKLWSSWKLSLIHTQHIVLYFPKLDAFSYLSAALIRRGRIVIRRERMWKMGDWCRLTSKPRDWHWWKLLENFPELSMDIFQVIHLSMWNLIFLLDLHVELRYFL